MLLFPCELDDVMFLTPSTPFTAFSIGSVIWVSMISAFAPTYEVRTFTTGGSIAGYSLTPKKEYPIAPNMMMTIEQTTAKTGRLILSSDKFIDVYLNVNS
jgi:hypothetical protein